MDHIEAERLIAPAVQRGGRWADLGAGSGTFTRALATLLGGGGRVIAVERDRSSVRELRTLATELGTNGATIEVVEADFAAAIELPPLDGVLIANALHYVPPERQAEVLGRVASSLVARGVLLVIEYENRTANRWVPYPVSSHRLRKLAREASLGDVHVIGSRLSEYGGSMYAAQIARVAFTDVQRAPTS